MGNAAQQAKEQGNAAFRAQQYAEAVGHYTTAMADAADLTLPLNRAFAYLKLGKYLDAERDCTIVLGLSPRHVKALYRRAQSRAGLNKLKEAEEDLRAAIRYEPNNEAVKTELRKIGQALSSSSSHVVVTSTSMSKPAPVQRRRVPIEIVESTRESPRSATSYEAPALPNQPQSSSQLSVTEAPSLPPSPTVNLSLNQPALSKACQSGHKQSIPSPSNTNVQGGIFRSSGESKIFRVPESSPAQHVRADNSTEPEKASTKAPSRPISLFELIRAWELANASERWDILCNVPPESLPTLFKSALDPTLLGQILDVCYEAVSANPDDSFKIRIREYLKYLDQVPRFATVSLFLSKREKEIGRRLGEIVGEETWKKLRK